MINNINLKKQISNSLLMVSLFVVSIFFTSCDYEYDLPESGSIADATPPSASFSATETEDYLTYTFSNTSSSATEYVWDFGDGNTSTDLDAENTYAAEGTYTVTLTAKDALGVTSVYSDTVIVLEPEVPASIIPEILNGDFTDGQTDWKIAAFTGGTTSPFNTSSDGDPLNYDGSDSGFGKTAGAKWTNSTSAGVYVSSSSRYAYQAITVTPNTEYTIEYSYAIKTDVADADGGDRVVVEILDGQFSDGVDAVASSTAGALVQSVGSVANGKGDFTILSTTFTSNDSGLVSIWIYAITEDELYVDNVKVTPTE